MKKLNTVAVLFASAALAAPMMALAQAKTVDNWQNPNGLIWKNGSNELCWRDANWTPGTANENCDGAPKPEPVAAPAPAPMPAPAPVEAPVAPRAAPAPVVVPVPVPVPAPAAPTSEKVSYQAESLFDFGKAALKKDAAAQLDDLVEKSKAINLEVIIAVGHTDSVGSDKVNQRLSVRRAEAVKAYLVGKGIEKSRIYTEGKGESSPVGDNKTKDGRAQNRRVEVEVVGTKTTP